MYLERFYKLSLSVSPSKLHIVEPPMKNGEMNNTQLSIYKNLIRNINHQDILEKTQSGIENSVTFLQMLHDLYDRFIIDYKILTPSARFYIRKGRIGSVFSSYFFRASILNPYLVYSLNMSVLKGRRIFTPTLGWSSYCYGFLECHQVIEYVGTDVIPHVCENTRALGKLGYPHKKLDIYCEPSEKLSKNSAFLKKYREHFDTVFFSPPYYRLELYEGGKQSTDQYKTYDEWLSGYWEPTVKLCYDVLEPGGKLCYIVSGYGQGTGQGLEQYDLIGDMNRITKKLFRLHSIQPLYNKGVYVTKHKEPAEKIIIFRK
jgi:hypothetical protein